MQTPTRYFRLKPGRPGGQAPWLDRKTVYRGKLVSMTNRVIRLYAPDPHATRKHIDLSYDWVTPCRDPHERPAPGPKDGNP